MNGTAGKTIRPFGSWPSSLSARSLVEGAVGLSALHASGERLYWLESRPDEGGRTVLVMYEGTSSVDLTPPPFNVRSRVHEYGGGAYAVHDQCVYFVNFADQNIHRIDSAGRITALTQGDDQCRFASFTVDARHNRLISVVEQHHPDREPENYLGAIDLESGALTPLSRGHDFYSSPCLSPDGQQLAFVAWDHPNMPWDGTVLKTARIGADGQLQDLANVAGGAQESVLQPRWQSDEALLFLSDGNGFWNLHRYDQSGIFCVLADGADYADPPWVFDIRNYTLIDTRHVLITRQQEAGQELVLVNSETTMATPFLGDEAPWCHYSSLCAFDGALHFIGSYPDQSPTIEQLPLSGGDATTLRSSGGTALNAKDVSRAEPIRFGTRDGLQAYAFFYPPRSSSHTGPADELPPLLVMSHGGPTGAAGVSLNLRTQYYTSRGWAVLDVNYRGSSGFGRAYRNALQGGWGELDVADCEDGVQHLIRENRVDADRVAIRGGSAGGYTTLAALTRTDCFRAGASHYGIGDLHALARDTHKFESRYLEGLLGDPAALTSRSPINHLDRFRCPVIFFQGSEDKVVPPNQSQAMALALREKGIPVAYLEFPGEGHGFRDAANIIRTVESEYGFFARVFGIETAEKLPDIVIDNAANL